MYHGRGPSSSVHVPFIECNAPAHDSIADTLWQLGYRASVGRSGHVAEAGLERSGHLLETLGVIRIHPALTSQVKGKQLHR